MGSLLSKALGWFTGPLQWAFTIMLEWLWGKVKSAILDWQQNRKEEKEVDEIVEKIKSPDLGEQLEGIEDAEDRLNRNT